MAIAQKIFGGSYQSYKQLKYLGNIKVSKYPELDKVLSDIETIWERLPKEGTKFTPTELFVKIFDERYYEKNPNKVSEITEDTLGQLNVSELVHLIDITLQDTINFISSIDSKKIGGKAINKKQLYNSFVKKVTNNLRFLYNALEISLARFESDNYVILNKGKVC